MNKDLIPESERDKEEEDVSEETPLVAEEGNPFDELETDTNEYFTGIDWQAFADDVSLATLMTAVDKGIKRRISFKQLPRPEVRTCWERFKIRMYGYKWLKGLALAVYIFLPIFERPGWCINNPSIPTASVSPYDYYFCQNQEKTIPNSNLPKLQPIVLNSVFILCLVILWMFTLTKDLYRHPSKSTVYTKRIQLILTVISILNMISSQIFVWGHNQNRLLVYPWISAFSRPPMLVVLMRSIRSFLFRYFKVIRTSFPLVLFILGFVMFFAWMLSTLLIGQIEGVENFPTFWEGFWSMFVLLTTANYPDVMLPAYRQSRADAIFLIFYLIVGLFLLLNLLLAIFYSNYKANVESAVMVNTKMRNKFVYEQFKSHDQDDKGGLNKTESKEMLNLIHSLAKGSDKTVDMKISEFQYTQIWSEVDHDNSGMLEVKDFKVLLEVYEGWIYEKTYKDAMEEIYGEQLLQKLKKKGEEQELEGSEAEEMANQGNWTKNLIKLMSGAGYELFINIIGIVNMFSLLVRQINSLNNLQFINAWIIIQIVINYLFLVETIVDWKAAGLVKAYSRRFRIWPESLCQIFNIVGSISYFVYKADVNSASTLDQSRQIELAATFNAIVKTFELIIFIRMTKILSMLYEVKSFRVIMETMKNLMGPIKSLAFVVLLQFYLFSLIGQFMFGGKVTLNNPAITHDESIPPNYALLNFNDPVSAFVTLFVLIVVNNWFVVVAMYVDVMGGHTAYRIYFIVWYYFGVLIGLNIIVAFAIDMYSAVLRLDEQKEKNEKYLVEVAETRRSPVVIIKDEKKNQ